jgi:hypothetical protein
MASGIVEVEFPRKFHRANLNVCNFCSKSQIRKMYFAAAQKELQLGSVKASSELVVSLLLLRWLNWLQIQLTNSVSTSKDTFLLKKTRNIFAPLPADYKWSVEKYN